MTKRLENRQIFPALMKKRHDELAKEMLNRGMKHESPYEITDISYLPDIQATRRDLNNNIADLKMRCKDCKELLEKTDVEIIEVKKRKKPKLPKTGFKVSI
jgi:hypothetical protein